MVLDELIDAFLRAALDQAGAERGLLMLWRAGEPRIAAKTTRRDDAVVVQMGEEGVSESLLPEPIIHHIQRTRESVVIDDAAQATRAADPFFRQHKARSILYLPLFNRAKLVGVLHLKSRLSSKAFAPERIKVLKLVAALAATAFENSSLYDDLQQRETKIRRLVDANIIGIYIIDLGGPIIEANAAFLRMLGYNRLDLDSGRLRWRDLTPPEWRAADAKRVERVKRIGRLRPFEKEYFRSDGTRVPVLVGVARFREPRNRAVVSRSIPARIG